jgi:hypothetical protein
VSNRAQPEGPPPEAPRVGDHLASFHNVCGHVACACAPGVQLCSCMPRSGARALVRTDGRTRHHSVCDHFTFRECAFNCTLDPFCDGSSYRRIGAKYLSMPP